MKYTQEEKDEAVKILKEHLKGVKELYCFTRHVSASGMQRSISCYAFKKDGREIKHIWLDRLICTALGLPFDKDREAVKVSGCGMNMHFWLVYEVASLLYKDGHKIKSITL